MKRDADRSGRHLHRRGFALLALSILAVLLIWFIGSRIEARGRVEQRGEMSLGFGMLNRVEYHGRTYIQKSNLTALLLMGVDRSANQEYRGFRQGGQADFLLLTVLDHDRKVVRQLQIDRDTMVEIETVGVLGNPLGTRVAQICLSHGFGKDSEANCNNTVAAVERMLGIHVERYAAVELNAIGLFNDALGGVPVTLEEDFTAYDPAMRAGATINLMGPQAETFVRYRIDIGDSSNESRMKRQRAYMSAASEKLRAQIDSDSNFIGLLYEALDGILTTDMSRGKVVNEVNRAYSYEILPVENPAGAYTLGTDGFMEFHLDTEALRAWVIEAFYVPQE